MLGLILLAAAATAPCPVERARYVLRHHPDWTAAYRPVDSGSDWPSGIALAVHRRSTQETFWWLPWQGGTDGLQNIASTEDVTAPDWRPPDPDGGPRPQGNRQYLGFDADYNLIDRVPRRGDPAPAHMLFPNAAGAGDRVFDWKDFFDLSGCSPAKDGRRA
ncbi:hypothetical protein [uncultured Sphingomonas sp.]|uniref:hypothetical protein n=1 Tax=uncultured Sphingomonas sp. TaxID=158754 RepID=UPI0025F50F19|nr:hypothetical protein [uncultured Sphingomonas sp.]